MANQKTQDERMSDEQTSKSQTGDPGRTASKAEGDRETIEQDLRDKERGGELNQKS
jgi:hypothetical protein